MDDGSDDEHDEDDDDDVDDVVVVVMTMMTVMMMIPVMVTTTPITNNEKNLYMCRYTRMKACMHTCPAGKCARLCASMTAYEHYMCVNERVFLSTISVWGSLNPKPMHCLNLRYKMPRSAKPEVSNI